MQRAAISQHALCAFVQRFYRVFTKHGKLKEHESTAPRTNLQKEKNKGNPILCFPTLFLEPFPSSKAVN